MLSKIVVFFLQWIEKIRSAGSHLLGRQEIILGVPEAVELNAEGDLTQPACHVEISCCVGVARVLRLFWR